MLQSHRFTNNFWLRNFWHKNYRYSTSKFLRVQYFLLWVHVRGIWCIYRNVMKRDEILCEMNLFHKVGPFKYKMTLVSVDLIRKHSSRMRTARLSTVSRSIPGPCIGGRGLLPSLIVYRTTDRRLWIHYLPTTSQLPWRDMIIATEASYSFELVIGTTALISSIFLPLESYLHGWNQFRPVWPGLCIRILPHFVRSTVLK